MFDLFKKTKIRPKKDFLGLHQDFNYLYKVLIPLIQIGSLPSVNVTRKAKSMDVIIGQFIPQAVKKEHEMEYERKELADPEHFSLIIKNADGKEVDLIKRGSLYHYWLAHQPKKIFGWKQYSTEILGRPAIEGSDELIRYFVKNGIPVNLLPFRHDALESNILNLMLRSVLKCHGDSTVSISRNTIKRFEQNIPLSVLIGSLKEEDSLGFRDELYDVGLQWQVRMLENSHFVLIGTEREGLDEIMQQNDLEVELF